MPSVTENLLAQLQTYQPFDAEEAASQQRFIEFIQQQPQCFSRQNRAGHVTASTWIVDDKQQAVLLTLHKKLGKWLQLGGHCEVGETPLQAALREAREESGLTQFRVLTPEIFNIDVHTIPAREEEPAHLHYDVAYLLQADDALSMLQCAPRESLALRWMPLATWDALWVDGAVQRMYLKWHQL